jgi:glycosyltransferase involved in cell wall biosynthesis
MKTALVYDRVNTKYGGAEHVLLALHQAFPQAPLYTAIFDKRAARWANVFEIKTSWVQRIPFAGKIHRLLAPLMPLAFESLDLSEFDVIISVSSAESKGVITSPRQLHICYLLSPPRYLYHQRDELVRDAWWSKIPGIAQLGRLGLWYLGWWDKAAMSRPDIVIALSKVVATRFKTIYKTQVDQVLYPPVITQQLKQELTQSVLKEFIAQHPSFLLLVARLVSYKRVDLAIAAAKLLQQPLIIIGTGPEKSRLCSQLNSTILQLDSVSEQELAWLYAHSQVVLVPGIEDFGLTALEANVYGKPAIVHYQAGAAETIDNGRHGLHLKQQSGEALANAVKKTQTLSFNQFELRQNAKKYDTSIFVKRFQQLVKQSWQQQSMQQER